jgi:hypothetical protein
MRRHPEWSRSPGVASDLARIATNLVRLESTSHPDAPVPAL